MIDKLMNLSLEDVKKGYTFHKPTRNYRCTICGKEFVSGEIFPINGRFFDASKAVELHIQMEHGDLFNLLTANDKKYTGITDNQKDLLYMIYNGMSDIEIARETGVAPSTIRHQRFVFREKAKQAKLYLALYELAMQGTDGSKRKVAKEDEIVDVHNGATMVDDRYFVTKAEEERILRNLFSSLTPLKLTTFATKEKNKIVILKKILEQFKRDKRYSEKEVNAIIGDIYEDFATIRRYMIEYGFMERTNDCKEYWLK